MKEKATKLPPPDGETAPPTLHDLFKGLGSRTDVVEETMRRLAEKGKHSNRGTAYARTTVYNVVLGRSQNVDIAEAFLEVVADDLDRRTRLAARAQQLAAKVQQLNQASAPATGPATA